MAMAYKILIVDDDKNLCEMFKDMLSDAGYEVVLAFGGEEGLAKIEEVDPDIILLDLGLPMMNGFEVLNKIRKDPAAKWRPVVIISGEGDMETANKSYELEANLYLAKPCPLETLLVGMRTMVALIERKKKMEGGGNG